MQRNSNLYNASAILVEASKLLIEVDEENRTKILDIAKNLLDKIEINQVELDKIQEYEDKLNEMIKETS
jgi:hypothetical protein